MKEVLPEEIYRLSTDSLYYDELDFWSLLDKGSMTLAENVCRDLQMQYQENLKELKEEESNKN